MKTIDLSSWNFSWLKMNPHLDNILVTLLISYLHWTSEGATMQKSSVIATTRIPKDFIHLIISAVKVAQKAGAGAKPNIILVAT